MCVGLVEQESAIGKALSFFPEMTGSGRHSHQIRWGGGESTWTCGRVGAWEQTDLQACSQAVVRFPDPTAGRGGQGRAAASVPLFLSLGSPWGAFQDAGLNSLPQDSESMGLGSGLGWVLESCVVGYTVQLGLRVFPSLHT